jgi:DNA-binding response OmpR family regulator
VSAHVVIAEDEPMIGRILEHKLVREGHRVSWVHDSSALLSALAAGDVDVALVDATLDRDGVEMMSEMAGTPRCGWLAMVEQRRADEQLRALECGAAGVVVKPFKPTAVAAQVQRLLEGTPV